MAKVVVTGANGFLGSWLVKALLNENHEVFSLVRKSSDLSELEGVPCNFVYGDISDVSSLEQAFKNCDAVFHLAGLIAYRSSDREKMQAVNVQGTANVISVCLSQKVKRLVHLSSVAAVGASFSPDHILDEKSSYEIGHLNLGYFETKRAAELLVINAVKNNGLDAVILNPSTIYGEGDARKGSRKTQIQVARGRFPIYTSGGVNVVAAKDVVFGIISAWQKGKSGQRYILSGENLTVKELFETIAQAAGVPPPKLLCPKFALHILGKSGDLLRNFGIEIGISNENAWTSTLYHWFNSKKAQNELGFKPSSAKAAIIESVHWMKENGYLRQ